MYRTNNYYMSANPFSVATGVPQSVTVFKNPYQLSLTKSKTQKKSKSGRQYASQKKVHTARTYGSSKKTHTMKNNSSSRNKTKKSKPARVLSAKQTPTRYSSSNNNNNTSKYIKSPKSLGTSPFSMKKNSYHTSSTKSIIKPRYSVLSPLSSLMNQFTVDASKTVDDATNFTDIDNASTTNYLNTNTNNYQTSTYTTKTQTKTKTKSPRKKRSHKKRHHHDNINNNNKVGLSPLSSILTKYNKTDRKQTSKKTTSTKDYSRKKNYYHSEKHSYAQQYSVSSSTKKPSTTDGNRTARKTSRKHHANHSSKDYSKHQNTKNTFRKSRHSKSKHKMRKFKAEKTSMVSMYQQDETNSKRNLHNQHNRSKSDPWNVGSLSLNDIKIKSMLGEGAFSKVYLVQFNQTKKVENSINEQLQNKNLALKVIEKKNNSNSNSSQSFEWERFALSQLSHPFIIDYYGSFFDDTKLCILTQFVIGGEILYHFENSQLGRFDNFTTQFYIGEIICALEYLHSKKYVYRDLKPENILIDNNGHIKLVDFGFAKRLSHKQRTYTLCGSKEYVAPEVLTGNGHSFEADFWSLGVLTYEFAVGHLPFPTQECDPYQVLGIMQQTQIDYPNYVDKYCIDFIQQLLIFNPTERSTNFIDIKNHYWFQSNHFNWQLCNRKGLKPPIMPKYKSSDDASNYATARFDIPSDNQNDDQFIDF